MFAIDNLKTDLVSPALAAALTTGTYTGRVLGSSQSVTGRIDWPWIVTANNPVVDTDIARRCVRIRLVPAVEEPWRLDPEAFPIPDLDAWMAEHEVGLTEAVLTLVQAWVRAGMPAGTKTLGSYEAWARVIGGVLDAAGIPGFLGNLDEFYDAANAERAGWRALVLAWWAEHGEQTVTVADLFALVEENAFDLRIGGKDDAGRRRSFGLRLKSQRDRVYEGFQLVSQGTAAGGAKAWRLVPRRPSDRNDRSDRIGGPRHVDSDGDGDRGEPNSCHSSHACHPAPANGASARRPAKFEEMSAEVAR